MSRSATPRRRPALLLSLCRGCGDVGCSSSRCGDCFCKQQRSVSSRRVPTGPPPSFVGLPADLPPRLEHGARGGRPPQPPARFSPRPRGRECKHWSRLSAQELARGSTCCGFHAGRLFLCVQDAENRNSFLVPVKPPLPL